MTVRGRDMDTRLTRALDRIAAVDSFEGLQAGIQDLRDLYDVDHVAYHAVNAAGGQYAALTYDHDWVTHYLDQDYDRIDPVVLGCYRRFNPVDWKALDWSPRAARRFLGEALDAGLGAQGLSVPVRGPHGRFALLTVNHRCDDRRWALFTSNFLQDLILIAHYVNEVALRLEGVDQTQPSSPLSPREIDALRLLGLGRSRAQAADALSISEHTLRAYLESARYKLGAANTTHAVALAVTRGQVLL